MTLQEAMNLPYSTPLHVHYMTIPFPIRIPAGSAYYAMLTGVDRGHFLRPVDSFTLASPCPTRRTLEIIGTTLL